MPATIASPTLQRAALDEHGGDRTAALVELGLDDDTAGGGVGVGLELEDVGLEQDHLEQVVDVQALLRRDVDEDVGAAPLLRHDLVLGEHLANLLGVGAVLVDLVDRDDDRHAGGLARGGWPRSSAA